MVKVWTRRRRTGNIIVDALCRKRERLIEGWLDSQIDKNAYIDAEKKKEKREFFFFLFFFLVCFFFFFLYFVHIERNSRTQQSQRQRQYWKPSEAAAATATAAPHSGSLFPPTFSSSSSYVYFQYPHPPTCSPTFPMAVFAFKTSTCCGHLELREALAVAASTGAPFNLKKKKFPSDQPPCLLSYYFAEHRIAVLL